MFCKCVYSSYGGGGAAITVDSLRVALHIRITLLCGAQFVDISCAQLRFHPVDRLSWNFWYLLFNNILYYLCLFELHDVSNMNIGSSNIVWWLISFHWHVQNATIPCRSQELLPFLSVMYFFLSPFSTNYSSILSHFILPSISWSASQSCCSQIHI
jgi:hypothetical protein